MLEGELWRGQGSAGEWLCVAVRGSTAPPLVRQWDGFEWCACTHEGMKLGALMAMITALLPILECILALRQLLGTGTTLPDAIDELLAVQKAARAYEAAGTSADPAPLLQAALNTLRLSKK